MDNVIELGLQVQPAMPLRLHGCPLQSYQEALQWVREQIKSHQTEYLSVEQLEWYIAFDKLLAEQLQVEPIQHVTVSSPKRQAITGTQLRLPIRDIK